MGFGGIFKQQNQQQSNLFGRQNQLNDMSNSLQLEAGQAQQAAANTEAAALRSQGDMAYTQSQQEQALYRRQNAVEAGTQTEQYLSAGVQMMGTPMQVVNETRALGQMHLDAMEQQGLLEQDLYYSKADITTNEGIQSNLKAQGQTYVNNLTNQINQENTRDQTQISQAMAQQQFYNGIFGGLLSGGLSILGGMV